MLPTGYLPQPIREGMFDLLRTTTKLNQIGAEILGIEAKKCNNMENSHAAQISQMNQLKANRHIPITTLTPIENNDSQSVSCQEHCQINEKVT